MKVVHIESGLGNQMLSYCEYLALQKMNPGEACFVETMVYEIPECNETICQWNGYELERVFGIQAPNVSSLFDEAGWKAIVAEVRKSEFWKRDWNWPVSITLALNHAGLRLVNGYGDREAQAQAAGRSLKGRLSRIDFSKSWLGARLRGPYYRLFEKRLLAGVNQQSQVFLRTDEDLFTGQRLCLKYRGNGIERLEEEIREAFRFPPLEDERNRQMAAQLEACNAVFIHARRGDMLSANGWCYKYGYFRRAVRYMKKHVEDPVFVFFTDPDSIAWCRENLRVFGLGAKDAVRFVDWNAGKDSFRDMQLMARCKHGIITNSTFGWWGTYFIQNPDKITISPEVYINTTHHCY